MLSLVYVVGDHAYKERALLEACEAVSADEAVCVKCLGLPPRHVYRVKCSDFEGLTADPVQVAHWTRRHREAAVSIIPISGAACPR